jgi:hypothetical protein
MTQVVEIPHEIIGKYARYREHVNAHILVLRDNIISDPLMEDLTVQFRKKKCAQHRLYMTAFGV